jgi:hypothetical protein
MVLVRRPVDAAKAEAMRRLRLIERVERLEAGNLTRSASVACAAAESGTSARPFGNGSRW